MLTVSKNATTDLRFECGVRFECDLLFRGDKGDGVRRERTLFTGDGGGRVANGVSVGEILAYYPRIYSDMLIAR